MLNTDDEKWLPVTEFVGLYEVSSKGRVRSMRRHGYVLHSNPTTRSPYLYVKIVVNMKLHNRSVHRLVALAFVPNPRGVGQVNHIDGDKMNNSAENLEWVTCSENHRHAFNLGLRTIDSAKTFTGKKNSYAVSGFHNVSFDKSRGKWKAGVKVNGVPVAQKRFVREEDAALFVNEVLDKYGLADRPRNVVS